jgi:meiotic recombination protein SPO11
LKGGDIIQLELHEYFALKKKSTLVFPSLKKHVNWKFTVYFKLLVLISSQLILNETISKRQLYYMDVKLFKKQSTVDECIDTLARCLGVPIESLRVTASQKGLVYADLSINDQLISRENGCSLVPILPLTSTSKDFEITFNEDPTVQPESIIILEKDAIFSGLVNREKQAALKKFNNSILVTGRGFPDRLTKHFVNVLVTRFPRMAVLGYFDSDVYGFIIALEYKLKPLSFLNRNPCCAGMQIEGSRLFQNVTSEADLILLTERDIQLSFSTFSNLETQESTIIEDLRYSITNLQRTLFFGFKQELKLEDVYSSCT